jgi:hypothetical protein
MVSPPLALTPVLAALMGILAASPAMAQPAGVLPNLPAPSVDENASPSAFLEAGITAVLTGQLGEAQEALEMAQTRLLDRSVPLFQTHTASDNPAVGQIGKALETLRAGDRAGCVRWIREALNTTHAQGL